MTPGDIAEVRGSEGGRKWRVTDVTREGLVTAKEVETGVVTRFHTDDLVLIERHPGGAGGGQS